MTRIRQFFLFVFSVVLFVPHAAGEGVHHTHVRLLADTKGIAPGQTFTMGVLMDMDRGWHTYWKNPGEAGLATRIFWTLPEGFKAGDILWPLPHKYIEEGDVLTLGYAGENMLLVHLTAPSNLRPGSRVTVLARIEWLECERICVPGEANLELSLPVVKGNPERDHVALFSSYERQVPPPYDSSAGIRLTTRAEDGTVELNLIPGDADRFSSQGSSGVDFYPEDIGGILVARPQVQITSGKATLRIGLSASNGVSGTRTLRGILLYTLEGKSSVSRALSIPLSEDFCRALHPGSSTGETPSILSRSFENISESPGANTLILYVAFALIGGVLLNVMPCVLPVIALKIFGLVRLAGDQPRRVKRLGLAFSGGILASFVFLALLVIVLQAAGEQVGWGFQFQEPRFVIALAAIVFAFGLSLFGVYEIVLPGTALNKVGSLLAQPTDGKNGYGASFGEGVFATILATPCTAPFLGSALGFAFSQQWPVILLIFTSVSIGMALPYLLITMRPGWIRFLPKPGDWMVTAKQVMGFLMMATMLWLLFILGSELGMEAVIWTGAFLLTVAVACWLVGRFAALTASTLRRRVIWIAALAIVVTGYTVFLESSLDIGMAEAVVSSQNTSAADSTGRIDWRPFSLSALESDLQTGKPVFVDFTAQWCLTCKVNEKAVLNSDAIVSRFRELGVIAVRADWTNRNPDITKLLAKFGRSGVPLYVIFPANHPESPIVLPELVTSDIVLEALQKAVRV
jgi:thiol:disulfide interchange protein/DsbC/DsbD-like thiol-disulfide interchange protein